MTVEEAERLILSVYKDYLMENYTYSNGRGCKRSILDMLGQTCVKYEHHLNNPNIAYSESNPLHKVFGCDKDKNGYIVARPLSENEGTARVNELLSYRTVCFIMEESKTSFDSCWSPNPFSLSPTISIEDENLLDSIIEVIAPNLSFLSYKRMKSILLATEVYEPEYYSEGTYYKIGLVSVSNLAEYLLGSRN